MHVAVDYLAGFGLTALLLDRLRAAAPSRVVNVVSDAMNDAGRSRRTAGPGRSPWIPVNSTTCAW